MMRALGWFTAALVGLVLVGVLAVVFLLQSAPGQRFVLRTAVNVVGGQIDGDLRVAGIRSPGLLRGVTLEGVAVVDAGGRPFLEVDSVRVAYGIRGFLARDAVLDPVELWRPRVRVETLPGDTVPNVVRIFAPEGARDVSGAAGEEEAGPGDSPSLRLELRRVRIHDGSFVLSPAEGEETRIEGIDARIPRAILLDPEADGETIWFDRLALVAHLPGIGEGPLEVEDFRGRVARRGENLEVEAGTLALLRTRIEGVLALNFGSEPTLTLDAVADPFDARDLAWLDARIPEARGRLRVGAEGPLAGGTWRLDEIALTTDRDRLEGQLALALGERPRILSSDLSFEGWTELAEPWVAEPLPISGRVRGQLRVEGDLRGLGVAGRIAVDDPRRGIPASEATVEGRFDLERQTGTGVALRVDPMRLETLRVVRESVAPGIQGWQGGGTLDLTLNGGLEAGLDLRASATHATAALDVSRVSVDGRIQRVGDAFVLGLDTAFEPLDWGGIEAGFGVVLPLQGALAGALRLEGPLTELEARGVLETPGGEVTVFARGDVTDPGRSYRLEGTTEALRLDALLAEAPEGSIVTGAFHLEGRGVDLGTLDAQGEVLLEDGRWGRWTLEEGDLRARVAEGRLFLDTIQLRSVLGELAGRGDLGLVAEVPEGRLEIGWALADLGDLRPTLYGQAALNPDTLTLLERSLLALEGFEEVPAEDPVPLAGALEAQLVLSGTLPDLAASLEAQGTGLAWAEAGAEDAMVSMRLRGGLRSETGWEVDDLRGSVELRALRWGRLDFASADLVAEGNLDGVEVSAELVRDPEERIEVAGRVQRGPAGWVQGTIDGDIDAAVDPAGAGRGGWGVIVDLTTLQLDLDAVTWALVAPARIGWEDRVLSVTNLEITRPPVGGVFVGGFSDIRIWVDGRVDLDGDLALRAEARGVDLARVARLAQLETVPEGFLALDLRMNGTALAPVIEGEVELRELELAGARLSRVAGEVAYRDEELRLRVDAEQDGRLLLGLEGRYPMILALAPVEQRFPSRDVDLTARLDDLPVATLLAPLDVLEEVRGRLSGEIRVQGRPDDLRPRGTLVLRGGGFSLPEVGFAIADLEGDFTLNPDGVVEVMASGRSGGPAEVAGTLDLSNLADPLFDLRVEVRNFLAVSRRDLDGRVTGNMQLRGRYTEPRVTGNIRVDQANLFLEEFARTAEVVDLTDPLFFERGFLEEEASAALRPVLEAARNPFLDNLRVDAELQLPRDVWLRSREMNVEIGGDLIVTFDRPSREILLVGQVAALRGNYNAFGRQFQVRGGTVDFVGTPGINPQLSIEAVHRLRQQGGDPLDIVATLEGNLLAMRITLASEGGVNISESDLISYLIFGRPSYALASAESRLLGDAAISAGIGAAAGQLSTLLGQQIGLDFFAITQAQDPAAGVGALSAEGLVDTQVELGQYLSENVFLALVLRPLRGIGGSQSQIPGARLEWRFTDLWTFNAYIEDRFGREGVFTFGEGGLRISRIFGLEILREWGY